MARNFRWLPIIVFVMVSFTGDFSANAEENVVAEKYRKLKEAKLAFEKEIQTVRLTVSSEEAVDRNIVRKHTRRASFNVLVDGEVSNNPDHLEPLLGKTWIFVDEVTFSSFPDWDPYYSSTSVFFDSEIQTVQDGVKLTCHDGLDRVCEMVVYTLFDSIFHYLRIANEDSEYPEDLVYIMELSGNVAEGEQAYLDEETETIIGQYPMTGFKWGSPVCDKNYDDKLGIAEALHYLRLAVGE